MTEHTNIEKKEKNIHHPSGLIQLWEALDESSAGGEAETQEALGGCGPARGGFQGPGLARVRGWSRRPYLVGGRMLLEVVDLAEFHACHGAHEGPHVLVLEHVILQLAAVVEGLVALRHW